MTAGHQPPSLESPRHWYDQWTSAYEGTAAPLMRDGSHAGEALEYVETARISLSWELSPDWFLPFLEAACRATAPALGIDASDAGALHRLQVALAPALLHSAQLGYVIGHRDGKEG